ncbi:MAG: response regulator, partial [Pseudomonadota bacterium]
MNHVPHILVVDDDSEIRQMLADYLQRNGLRVSQADGGRAMRALMDTHAVDLVVLDVMMPGEDGLSLCRNLRAGKHRAVPVVLLTARDDETDRIIGLEMG